MKTVRKNVANNYLHMSISLNFFSQLIKIAMKSGHDDENEIRFGE
jgi:hypothetical protein